MHSRYFFIFFSKEVERWSIIYMQVSAWYVWNCPHVSKNNGEVFELQYWWLLAEKIHKIDSNQIEIVLGTGSLCCAFAAKRSIITFRKYIVKIISFACLFVGGKSWSRTKISEHSTLSCTLHCIQLWDPQNHSGADFLPLPSTLMIITDSLFCFCLALTFIFFTLTLLLNAFAQEEN